MGGGAGLRDGFARHLPRKPYCADYLAEGLLIRSVASALERRHIQFNGPATFSWLLHDIDHAQSAFAHRDANLPPPNVMILNQQNGHGHAATLLAVPVARHCAARLAPLRLYAAVDRGLTRRLDADRTFAGLIAKNPLHSDWRVEWRRDTPYTLGELEGWLFAKDMVPESQPRTTFGAGRNVTVFDELRAVAYKEALRYKRAGDGHLEFRARLGHVAQALNSQFARPLSPSEISAIAKSVANWTWKRFSPERFSAIQRHRAQTRTRKHLAVIAEIKNGA